MRKMDIIQANVITDTFYSQLFFEIQMLMEV